jgi:hypothetical protein
MNRPSVDPAFTFAVSLAVSLVLWIRYFLALAIAWCGVYGVSAIVAMYAGKPRPPSPRPPDPGVRAVAPARRQDDPPAEPAGEVSESNAA